MRPGFLHNNSSRQNYQQNKDQTKSSSELSNSSSSQYFKQRNGSGQGGGQGTPPPSVVLLLDESGTNGGIKGNTVKVSERKTTTNNQNRRQPLSQSSALLTRNPSVDIHSPEREPLMSGQRIISITNSFSSRSPSASSLTSTGGGLLITTSSNSHHCSPNPSPPPTSVQTSPSSSIVIQSAGKYSTGNSTRVLQSGGSGSVSVARMMSSLLKQQNSIAEEEPENSSFEEKEEKQQNLIQQNLQQIIEDNTILQRQQLNNTNNDEQQKNQQNYLPQNNQQKCWLAPPDHTLLGGNISPPPTRIHPVQDPEMRKELDEKVSTNDLIKQKHFEKQQNIQQSTQPILTGELGRHLVALATPIATGPASPSAAVINHYQQQQGTKEYSKDSNTSKGWYRQQSQPWSARGATSKHRKGSLSPNNSLRYSTLMAAATRRNNFQQQRTTSEATPAQRDQLMSDVLGHGIRDQCVCASVSAPSPRLLASNIATDQLGENNIINTDSHHSSCCSSSIPSHHSRRCPLRFELGGGDSSASSLNGVGGVHAKGDQCCSQCSSANSLHRAGSIKQRCVPRGRLNTVDRCSGADNAVPGTGGSGSLPRLVTFIPSAFPPASAMLSSELSPQQSPSQLQHSQLTQLLQRTSDQRNRTQSGGGKRRRTEEEKLFSHPPLLSQRPISDSFGSIGSNKIAPTSPPFSSSPQSTLFPPNAKKGDPTRFNFASTKQRSSSEMAFSNIPKIMLLPGRLLKNKNLSQISSNCCSTMRRPESMSALGNSHSEHRRCSSIALVHQEREQAILQRILGPTGDPLLKKSLSLIFNDGDIESQRPGAVSAIGGFGGGGHSAPPCPPTNSERGGGPGSVLDESINCSVKQPLVKEKERGGRFIKRQQLFNKRRVTSDYALFFVLFGIVLMIIENEFAYLNHFMICTALKTVILISTIILVGLVVKYHVHEIQLFMNANSAEDWQIALTCRKSMQIIIEVVACAICPLPVQLDGNIWPTIPKRMPLDVLFSILMFFRLYWLCRVMLLHSRLFTDAASRSIAGLNRVKTDAKFILKTLMTICPGTVLMLFTASLWMIGGYILRLCERHNSIEDPTLSFHAEKHQSYLNSLWLVAVTFLSIGYGDIVPNTQCGRIMAVVTGILGTCTSSMVVAVIARKLELTRAEKHVHNFMIETQHTKEMKHIAVSFFVNINLANVLRETWLIYKNRRLVDKIEPSRIRYHQRKFLVAICALRKLKTSQRKLEENRVSLGDVAKTTAHSHDLMRDEGMALRITAVEHQLSDIQRELSNLSELLRFALRPQIEYSCSPTQQFQHYDQNQQEHPSSMITLSTTQMASGQQNIVETRQRRKPSALSEPIT
uniref:CaMBD domain-containing protein n=2 Tax=Meloidogyne hapla TaxID=6305 RepID=A0A1I8BKF5_MELHA